MESRHYLTTETWEERVLAPARVVELAGAVVEDWGMSGLGYDRAASVRLEQAYTTGDVQEQRDAVRRVLQARAGEGILDHGSGPGILACELAVEVGPGGKVTAVDVSEEMNAIASRRAQEAGLSDRIEVVQGDVLALGFPDACFDAAISTQVLEYVHDVGRALRELRRVLRPGGRLVLLDTDWDTLVWSARDTARSARILKAWGRHAPHAHLPRHLAPQLRACDFDVTEVSSLTLLNTSYNQSTYSYNLAGLVAHFVRTNGAVSEDELDAWLAELASLDNDGAYFFSINRYCFSARRGIA
jgi:ubiquinone/menaquinone biosynthesis C-methylase UbiE